MPSLPGFGSRFAALIGSLKRNGERLYIPKYCRARGCNQLFGHKERHNGRHREPLTITVPPFGNRYGEFSHYPGPRRSPKAAQVPGSRQRMAEYRRARNTPRNLVHR